MNFIMPDIWWLRLTAIGLFAAEAFLPSLTETQRASGWVMIVVLTCTVAILRAIGEKP